MAEDLKHLIDQIQKEGVEQAEKQAEAIVSQAKEKAAKLVAEAERKAEELKAKAEAEAKDFAERSTQTLKQAARDLLITVGQGCERVVQDILGRKVDESLKGDLLEKLLLKLLEQHPEGDVAIGVSEEDAKALADFCVKQAKAQGREIELQTDSEVISGFRVVFKDSNAYLDYTGEALAEALGAFLRPELAGIVKKAAEEELAKA